MESQRANVRQKHAAASTSVGVIGRIHSERSLLLGVYTLCTIYLHTAACLRAYDEVADVPTPDVQHIIGQYYQFLRLGFSGYKRIINSCAIVARHTADKIEALGSFDVVSVRPPVQNCLASRACWGST